MTVQWSHVAGLTAFVVAVCLLGLSMGEPETPVRCTTDADCCAQFGGEACE